MLQWLHLNRLVSSVNYQGITWPVVPKRSAEIVGNLGTPAGGVPRPRMLYHKEHVLTAGNKDTVDSNALSCRLLVWLLAGSWRHHQPKTPR